MAELDERQSLWGGAGRVGDNGAVAGASESGSRCAGAGGAAAGVADGGGVVARDGGVADDSIADALRKDVLVGGGGDFASLLGMGNEAALKEDGGTFDRAEHGEACALDAAIDGLRLLDGSAVYGCCKRDIFTVLVVAGEIFGSACSREGGGCAMRRQGKCFDAGCGAATGVMVDADEKGLGGSVGDGDPIPEGKEEITVARHHDLKTQFIELFAHLQRESEVAILLACVGTHRSGVVSPMSGIKNDRCDATGLGEPWTQHRIDKFAHIDGGDIEQSSALHDGVGENVTEVVDIKILF